MSNLVNGHESSNAGTGHRTDSKFHIIVNASPFEVAGPQISYRELVNLAFPSDPGQIIYLIQYISPHGPDGQLHEGESVDLENGMKFNVERTHRS
jgi:Multiubiquitin